MAINEKKTTIKRGIIIVFLVFLFLMPIFLYYSRTASENNPIFRAQKDGSYIVSNRTYSSHLSLTESNQPSVSFQLTKTHPSISLSLKTKDEYEIELNKKENKLVYINKGTDKIKIEYSSLNNGIKEDIIIQEPPNSHLIPFTLKTSSISMPQKIGDFMQPTFYDIEGNYQFHLERPYAIDANGNRSDNFSYTIKKSDNGYDVGLNFDSVWLRDSNTKYPVTIDPTIVHDTTVEFAVGEFNRTTDTGSSIDPRIETYYQELTADEYTIGLWHLDETSGNAIDSGGNGLTGTPTGTTIVPGKINNARSFNGSSDLISMGDVDVIDNAKTLSSCAWVYHDSITADHAIIHNGIDSTDGIYLFRDDVGSASGRTDVYTIYIADSNSTNNIRIESTSNTALANQWNHVCFTFEAGKAQGLRLYINGSEDINGPVSTSTVSGINTGPNPLRIGNFNGTTSYFAGDIDEIIISQRIFTPEEIKSASSRRLSSVYTSEVLDVGGANSFVTEWNDFSWSELGVATGDGEIPYDSTGLIAQWNFNETSGTTAANNAGSCGASCNGTLTNFASTASQDQAAGTGWTSNNRRWGAGALMFDGINDYVACTDANCGTTSRLDFDEGQDFSIESWARSVSTGVQQIISGKKAGTGVGVGYVIHFDSAGKILCRISDSITQVTLTSPLVYQDGKWHYIACTINRANQTATLYVDGAIVSGPSSISAVGSLDNTIDFRIGDNGNIAGPLSGSIDSVRVYSRSLSSSEIISNYNAGNIELQTRVGNSTAPDDGTWDAWSPTANETQINSFDADETNWDWDSTATYMPHVKTNESNIKVEGTGSLKQVVGQIQTDANTVGLWRLNETSGSGAYLKDSSGNSNHGTPTGTTTTTGISDKGRSFNGTSDYIDMGDPVEVDFGTGNFTLEAWVKRDTIGATQMIISKDSDTTGRQLFLAFLSTNIIRISYNTSGNQVYLDSTTAISDYNWHHIVGQRVGNSFSIYIDGILSNSGTSGGTHGTMLSTATNLRLGQRPYTGNLNYFHGSIDEVRISNIARSAEEIAETYRAGRDHYLNKTISSTDLSGKTSLPFYVAADRPGSYLQASLGESPYSIGQPDANTVGLWRLDDDSLGHATGGTITYSGGYTIHTFTTSGTFTPNGVKSADVLVVAGGGGGGSSISGYGGGGGGGAGGLKYQASQSIGTSPITVTVGSGGAGGTINAGQNGTNGGNSIFDTITSDGGGGGGNGYTPNNNSGVDGGSGGGSGFNGYATATVGFGISGQGNNGGQNGATSGAGGGGGGGAGAVGGTPTNSPLHNGGVGGNGLAYDISGTSTYYAGGGAGSGDTVSGGLGGGGAVVSSIGQNGSTNTGGGGGGSYAASGKGGDGGSGIVIVRYPTRYTQIQDSSGNNYSGTPYGTTLTEGKIGKGRDFNGTSDYINAGTSSTLDFSTSFTIDAWIYRSATQNSSDSAIVSKIGNSGASYPGYMLYYNGNTVDLYINGGNRANSTTIIPANTWTHVTGVWTGTLAQIYINGVLSVSSSYSTAPTSSSHPLYIGRYDSVLTRMFTGSIDEVRISNIARSANEIRASYEYGLGLRSHPITIDFGASLDAGNLIANSGDLSFTVDATVYGLSSKGSKLFAGDKVIVKENYDGAEYIAQGTVTGVTTSSGAVTVASWDSGSTFPSGGYTASASVFKWQREYWKHNGNVLASHIDSTTQLSLRLTDGAEGRTIYIDNLKASDGYLTTPAGSTITSSFGKRFLQYRAILTSSDSYLSPQLSQINIDYEINAPPLTPTLDSPIGDAAYGGMLVYCDDTTDVIKYRILDSAGNWGTVGDAADIDTGTSNKRCERTQVYSSPNSSEKVLLSIHNDATTTYIYSQVWDGSSWGNVQFLSSPPFNSTASRKADGAYLTNGSFMTIYADSTTTPAFAIWNGSSWSTVGGATQSIGSNAYTIISRARPGTNEVMTVIQDSGNDAVSLYYDGTGTDPSDFTYIEHAGQAPSGNGYHVDFAWSQNNPLRGAFIYTNSSGDTSPVINIFTADGIGGGSWGTPNESQTLPNALGAQQIVDRPGTNEFLTCNDDVVSNVTCFEESDNDTTPTLQATTNGILATGTETDDDTHSFDLAYEQQSGATAIAVYSDGTSTPKLKRYNPGTNTWEITPTNMTVQTNTIKSVDLIPDPNSNDIIIITRDISLDVHTTFWDGTNNQLYSSGDRSNIEHSTNCGGSTDSHCADFAWDLHGSEVAINLPLTPTLKTTSTDPDGDYLRYKIEICEDESMTINCQIFDQTTSQTGWSGQNTESTTAYTSGTQATYTLQTNLQAGTTYHWKSYTIDPNGANVWSNTQDTPSLFITSDTPTSPTLNLPSYNSTNVSLLPQLRLTATDGDGDYLRYEIKICTNAELTVGCQTFNQSASQTGWSGQNAEASTAYTSGTQGIYTVQSALSHSTTYFWAGRAIDPEGSNSLSSFSTTYSFTTSPISTTKSCYVVKAHNNSSITVYWNDSVGEKDGYTLHRSINGGAFTDLITVADTVQNYTDNTVSNGNTYQYRVASTLETVLGNWCTTSVTDLQTGSFIIY